MSFFSIIIPSYNNFELFSNAINSILHQDFKDIEVIVTDDSTTKAIENYCKGLIDSRIVYYRRENKSCGVIGNWNNGLRKLTGKYTLVLHHDEELGDCHFLFRLFDKFSKGYDLVISDIRVREGEQFRRGRINGLIKKILLRVPSSLFAVNSIGPCACIAFSTDLLQEFDESLTWLVDVDWYYRLIKSAKSPLYLQESIIKSNSGHKDQITNNIDIKEKDREDRKLLKKKYCSYLGVQFFLTSSPLITIIKKHMRRIH